MAEGWKNQVMTSTFHAESKDKIEYIDTVMLMVEVGRL
jgi:hypothetical protein